MNIWQVKTINNNYMINVNYRLFPCQIGKNGIISQHLKTEGDCSTPAGLWKLKTLYYREKKFELVVKNISKKIKIKKISKNIGWCDDINNNFYNKEIEIIKNNIFFNGHYEKLYRDDSAYDIFFELGYNDNPIINGKGSAIFLHCSFENLRSTAGCVAISKKNFHYLLDNLEADTYLEILSN